MESQAGLTPVHPLQPQRVPVPGRQGAGRHGTLLERALPVQQIDTGPLKEALFRVGWQSHPPGSS